MMEHEGKFCRKPLDGETKPRAERRFSTSDKVPLDINELSTGQFAINSVSKEHTNEKLNKVLDY